MSPPPRIVTLVVDEPRGVLPPFEVESPWWMESGPVVEQARLQFGLDVVVVRLLDGDRFPGGSVTYLAEAPTVDADDLAPFSGELDDDPRRPRYAEPGGVAELIGWVDGELDAIGSERLGPPEQVRTWNLSCLLRFPTTEGLLWLKAVPEFFAHETEVVRAVGGVDPSLVPELVAARPGTMLMREAGDADGYDVGPDEHFQAVERFHRAASALDLGKLRSVPWVTLDDFQASLHDLVERHGDELAVDDRDRLAALVGESRDRWRAGGPVDQALVHGDLHGGNLRVGSGNLRVGSGNLRVGSGGAIVLDWGDASITHPLFDLAVLDNYTPDWPPAATDRWLELLGVGRAEWAAFRPLAAMRLAVIYRCFCDRIERSEQIYHRGDIVPAIRSALRLLD